MPKVMMPHQRDILRYSLIVQHPAVFAEMRLGKTLSTIRRLQMYTPRGNKLRFLIVAPNSALGSWERELKDDGETDIVFLQGTRKQRLALLESDDWIWALINKEGWRSIPEIARELWDAVVADESTFLKNPQAKVTRFFLSNFRAVPHRWALTGMPNPEGPLDLWCQLAFLDGHAFGCDSYWKHRARHYEPDSSGFGWTPKPGVAEMMQAELGSRAFCLRRRDAGMVTRRVYERREVELPKKLRDAYSDAEKLFVLEYDEAEVKRTVWATERWHWMRRLCAGFVDRKLVWPGKIKELVSLARGELYGEQVVVWFAYNAEIYECAKALRAANVRAEVMVGETKPERRRALENHFRKGWFRVFLIQEMLGESGLDLSTADTAMYFSNNPGYFARVESEARIEHPKKTTPCLYIDLVAKDTVEEVISENLLIKGYRSQSMFDRAVMHGMRQRRIA